MYPKTKAKQCAERILSGTVLLACFLGIFFLLPPFGMSITLGLILAYILCTEWPRLFARHPLQGILLAPLYPILPFVLLIQLHQQATSRPVFLYLFATVGLFDTASYFFGSTFGRRKLASGVSPGKTWEGFLLGLLTTTVTLTATFALLFHPSLTNLVRLSLLTVATCATALLGDVFESWLKRRAGVKDSGSLLPGHGGLLDRFDGILAAAYFLFFV